MNVFRSFLASAVFICSGTSAQTLQSVTDNGHNTTSNPIVINAGSVEPVTNNNLFTTGSLNLICSLTGPSLSAGIVNTNNASTHWGWLQTAYTNSPGVYGKLALNPLGGNVGIGTNSPSEPLTVQGNIRLTPYYNNSGIHAYDAV